MDDWQIARILDIWKPAITGAPERRPDALDIPVKGGFVHITRQSISLTTQGDTAPTPEVMRAAQMHILELWGGKATIPFSPKATPESRLLQHAYARVYGIELTDHNGALPQAQLARLPALCAEIRARHPDAPPPRPADRQQQTEQQPIA